MEKELDELDKTTDVLKTFKSRVGMEEPTEDIGALIDEWNENNHKEAIPLQDATDLEDKTLILNDFEQDKTIRLDKTIDIKQINSRMDEMAKQNEIADLDALLAKNQKVKKIGIKLIQKSMIFIPLIITLIIIGKHSNKLITSNMLLLLFIALIIIGIVMVIGLVLYLKNIHVKTNIKISSMYVYLMTFYIASCMTFLFLIYGVLDLKKWLVTTFINSDSHEYYCTWFYSDDEINTILENEKKE